MSVVVVRYRTRPERADENEALVEQVFAELASSRPDGLRYVTFRLADGEQFVHVAEVDTADGTNPLSDIAAFGVFQERIPEPMVEGPVVADATLVGSYGFGFDA
jgi:tRNA (Thr-GGU) A37 N-methylase